MTAVVAAPRQKKVSTMALPSRPSFRQFGFAKRRDIVFEKKVLPFIQKVGLSEKLQGTIALRSLFRSPDWRARYTATEFLATAKPLAVLMEHKAIFPFVYALEDEHPHVRSSAARALGVFGDKRAVKPLFSALRDQDANVRWSAAIALRSLGYPTPLEAMALATSQETARKKVA